MDFHGSKATIADLEWVRASGIGARLRALADAGVPVLGICGGFQMLGDELRDPIGIEGSRGRVRGLGLLRTRTTFGPRKRTEQVTGRVRSGGFANLEGIELGVWEFNGDAIRFYEQLGYTTLSRMMSKPLRDPSGS